MWAVDPAAAVGPLGGRSEPEVPRQAGRHGGRQLRALDRLVPVFAGPVGPAMDFADGADRAVAEDFDDSPRTAERVPLVSHLRDDVHFAGNLAHPPGFVNRMRERLLTIDVLAQLHRHDAGRSVMVIGCGDNDRIDVLALFEHLAVVFVLGDARILLVSFGGAIVIGVAQRDDILLGAPRDIDLPLSAGADGRDIELLVRRAAGRPQRLPRDPNRRAQGGRLFHELASRCLSNHVAPCASGLARLSFDRRLHKLSCLRTIHHAWETSRIATARGTTARNDPSGRWHRPAEGRTDRIDRSGPARVEAASRSSIIYTTH